LAAKSAGRVTEPAGNLVLIPSTELEPPRGQGAPRRKGEHHLCDRLQPLPHATKLLVVRLVCSRRRRGGTASVPRNSGAGFYDMHPLPCITSRGVASVLLLIYSHLRTQSVPPRRSLSGTPPGLPENKRHV